MFSEEKSLLAMVQNSTPRKQHLEFSTQQLCVNNKMTIFLAVSSELESIKNTSMTGLCERVSLLSLDPQCLSISGKLKNSQV